MATNNGATNDGDMLDYDDDEEEEVMEKQDEGQDVKK
jgi:hypothetical protein